MAVGSKSTTINRTYCLLPHLQCQSSCACDSTCRAMSSSGSMSTVATTGQSTSYLECMKTKRPTSSTLRQQHWACSPENLSRGMRRTYFTLCKKYPCPQIPQRVVAEYVAECPECQKIRHSMNDRFQPLLRANHVDHHHQMIGIDELTITPPDIHGMTYAYCWNKYILNLQLFAYVNKQL